MKESRDIKYDRSILERKYSSQYTPPCRWRNANNLGRRGSSLNETVWLRVGFLLGRWRAFLKNERTTSWWLLSWQPPGLALLDHFFFSFRQKCLPVAWTYVEYRVRQYHIHKNSIVMGLLNSPWFCDVFRMTSLWLVLVHQKDRCEKIALDRNPSREQTTSCSLSQWSPKCIVAPTIVTISKNRNSKWSSTSRSPQSCFAKQR